MGGGGADPAVRGLADPLGRDEQTARMARGRAVSVRPTDTRRGPRDPRADRERDGARRDPRSAAGGHAAVAEPARIALGLAPYPALQGGATARAAAVLVQHSPHLP